MTENASLQRSPMPLTDHSGLRREVADLIVQALNLTVTDSIDILEIALVVSTNYGIELRADGEENQHIFGSLQRLVDHIAAHRTK